MRKIIALALTACMTLSLSACGSKEKDVEITFPASMMEGATQEELEKDLPDEVKSSKLNDDGSVTVTMSEETHKELMAEFAEEIDESLEDIVNNEEYANITDIKHNEDFTHFDVILASDTPSMVDYMTLMGFYMYGVMYNVGSGAGADVKITVDFRDPSGAVIESADNSNITG